MEPNCPIGVFDSGAGGLSILFEIQRLLPSEDCVYFADTLHCPWGPRPAAEIRALAANATERLLAEGAKVIVVACNSASTVALADLRASYPVPFVGTVPAVKPAGLVTRTGRIAVLGTAATVRTDAVSRLIQEFAPEREVFCRACPDRLVELVEALGVDAPEAEACLGDVLKPLLAQGVDTIVLGCTHYAFLRPVVERLAGPSVTILDTGVPIARQVKRVLDDWGLARPGSPKGTVRYLASRDPVAFAETARELRTIYRRHLVARP